MLGLGNSIAGGASLEQAFDAYSISFDGTDDFLENTSFDNTLIQDAYTMSVWVKVAAGDANRAIIGMFSLDGADDDTYYLRTNTNGVVRSQQKGSGGNKFLQTASDIRGSWTHVVASWTKSDLMHIYVNGSATNHTSTYDTDLLDGNDGIRIGSKDRGGAPTNIYSGLVNDVAIWSAELDQTAITALYNSGKPMDVTDSYSSNLVAYWKMEEGTGTTVADSSSNSYTLTLTNGPTWSTDVP